MSESNKRILQKRYAEKVADEIFTIETEIDNMKTKLASVNFKQLKKISYPKLKQLREALQRISSDVGHVNRKIEEISKPNDYQPNVVIEDENKSILVPKNEYEDQLMQLNKNGKK